MRNTQRIEAAGMSLTQAINRSYAAQHFDDEDGRAVSEHVLAAELRLRRGGHEDLALRLEDVLDDVDVTSSEARTEIREVAQLIEGELDPDVTVDSFRTASDGGERR